VSLSRRWAPFLLCLGMVLVPVLLIGGRSGGGSTNVVASSGRFGTARAADLRTFDLPLTGVGTPLDPGVQDAVVAGNAPAVPAKLPRPATVHHASPVVLTRPVVHRVATPPAPVAARPSQTGPASWYPAPAGTCAHPSLPLGTIVTVTDLANGRTTTCRVADRGPYQGGRIIDLSESTFAQLASPSSGVIEVRISW
jgi:hypothetical protein